MIEEMKVGVLGRVEGFTNPESADLGADGRSVFVSNVTRRGTVIATSPTMTQIHVLHSGRHHLLRYDGYETLANPADVKRVLSAVPRRRARFVGAGCQRRRGQSFGHGARPVRVVTNRNASPLQ